MSQYADNRTDCRRAQILEYFGEIFDRNKCIDSKMSTACDNCLTFASDGFETINIFDMVLAICRGVQSVGNTDATLLHYCEILKGSMNAKVVKDGHDKLEMHGKMKAYKKNDVERVLRQLICDGYLVEDVKINSYTDTVACYIKLGPKGQQLLRNPSPAVINFAFIRGDSSSAKPIVVNKRDSLNMFQSDASDDDIEEDSEAEEAGGEGAKSVVKAKRKLSDRVELEKKCGLDLKFKIKELCARAKHANYATIFNIQMLKQMVMKWT